MVLHAVEVRRLRVVGEPDADDDGRPVHPCSALADGCVSRSDGGTGAPSDAPTSPVRI